MLSTYRAVLRGEFLEWSNEKPIAFQPDDPVEVHVTILEETSLSALPQDKTQGQRMADALEQLARLQSSSLPDDPLTWERETRADRALPGWEA